MRGGEGQDERRRAQALLSTIGFVAGGAALAGGALLVFSAPRSAPKTTMAVGPMGLWLAREW
ncbi:MAG: hypothetical protein KIT84_26335 [Labilithrix sp.]|nr:hypothetical protein [Labilithrix sp.]MCW5814574.1 hypothetical protein [Labilithrix sp.]